MGIYSFLSLFILTTSPVSIAKHSKTYNFENATYIKNYDADTVQFNIKGIHPLFGKKISVRVRGIDAPESRSKILCEKELSRQGRNLVARLLKNSKKIDLLNAERGKYFRIVADILFDGKNLKDVLLKNKLAVPYDGGRKVASKICN